MKVEWQLKFYNNGTGNVSQELFLSERPTTEVFNRLVWDWAIEKCIIEPSRADWIYFRVADQDGTLYIKYGPDRYDYEYADFKLRPVLNIGGQRFKLKPLD